MKIIFCGDIVGKAGRKALKQFLPKMMKTYTPDVVIANVENAAHGFGLTEKIYNELHSMGIDMMTMGNHTFDKKEIFALLQADLPLVRPLNYPENTLGKGWTIYGLPDGRKLALLQLIGTTFMRPADNPFLSVDKWLNTYKERYNLSAILVDFHAEATAEKMAMGFYLDGRVSAVLGTHTHIPTADGRILPKGTAYQTDVGMCGDYHSIIGMKISDALPRFLEKPTQILSPAEEKGTLCGVYIKINDTTGLAEEIVPLRQGAYLSVFPE